MTTNGERKIGSLRDLPRDVAPPRDLWQGVAARIAAEQSAASSHPGSDATRRFARSTRTRVLAAAAVIAALAIGIWIGRAVLPASQSPAGGVLSANNHPDFNNQAGVSNQSGRFDYVMDPRYTRDRAALVKGLEARLAALPPSSREKVMTSLKAINDSKRELEAQLGKDPSNALLQELLVNTYQDEMRVLTAVHEAGRNGEGI